MRPAALQLTLACLLAALLPARLARALPPDTWVVTIGNNHGHHGDVELLYAQRDTEQVADVLRRLGVVPSARIVRLVDEDADAVRRAILHVDENLRELSRKNVPSALIVFYSGHADARALHLGDSELAFDELRSLIKSSPADMRLLVVDACRSGGISRVKGVSAAPSFAIDLSAELPEGFAVLTSSAAGEDSQESDQLQGSFFTHHFVNALRGAADRNGDGEVSLSEAYAYTYEETLRSSGSTLQLQHPTYAWEVKGRGDLVLTRPLASDGHSGVVVLRETVPHLFYDARSQALVAEVNPPGPNAHLALPARSYHVEERKSDAYLNYDIEVPAGRSIVLADQPYHAVRYDRLVRKGGGDSSVSNGILLLGGGRGELVDGEGVTPTVTLGYTAALRWFTAEARAGFGTTRVAAREGLSPRRHNQVAFAITLQRFVDLSWASVAFGVLLEGALHQQHFEGPKAPSDRRSASFSFAALAALERPLFGGLGLRVEAGPISTLFRGSAVSNGREVDTGLQSEFTWLAAAGIVQRF